MQLLLITCLGKSDRIMYKILITGAIHETGLGILRKEKDIEIQYAPDLDLTEIFKIIAPTFKTVLYLQLI